MVMKRRNTNFCASNDVNQEWEIPQSGIVPWFRNPKRRSFDYATAMIRGI